MEPEQVSMFIRCVSLFEKAWGRDKEYWGIWNALNMVLCMWLYRRQVASSLPSYSSRAVRLVEEQWGQMLMALTADHTYMDWLRGRHVGDRDRAPCYERITTIMGRRFFDITGGVKMVWLRPPWSRGTKG